MASSTSALESRAPIEDVLAHLPISRLTRYRKGDTIYGPEQRSKGLYLVAEGKVQLSRIAEGGGEILLDIIGPEELFGEPAFHAAPRNSERAIAHEKAGVMAWATSEIESLAAERPRL